MDRVLFIPILTISLLVFLFFPIYLDANIHYDMNRRKLSFAIYFYNFLKVIGGYIATYSGGLAFHITEKRAILLPYRQLKEERKRFSFLRTFHLKKLSLTAETGADYLMPVFLAQMLVRIYVLTIYRELHKIKTNFWLKNGDELLLSVHCTFMFNLFMILSNLFHIFKEKIKFIWQKNITKSTI